MQEKWPKEVWKLNEQGVYDSSQGHLNAKLGYHDIITYSSDLYQAMHTDLMNIAKRNGGDHDCILLVAHNPGMEMFAGRMARTSPEHP